jgi:acetyl-CoA carboxylase carboxyl transferase subunit beta
MGWWKREDSGLTGPADKKGVPKGVWAKCDACAAIVTEDELRQSFGVCPKCGHHHRLDTRTRLELLIDEGTFEELGADVTPLDPLQFRDAKKYKDRVRSAQKESGYSEAVVSGLARLEGKPVGIAVMAFEFMGGSMGSVVGERITRMFEGATARQCAAIICCSSGGARMQEGVLSLMQMAKTTAALRRHRDAGYPYISVLCHPTTGGVAASFAMLGDIILAEPGALIGFAGPRVIEQTIRQKLPEGFQRSEFLLDHGMIDAIVSRGEMRATLSSVIGLLTKNTLS